MSHIAHTRIAITKDVRFSFDIGDLVLHDEQVAAVVLERDAVHGVPLYGLRLANGYLAPSVVEGYLQRWPIKRDCPPFEPLRTHCLSSRGWCESTA